MNAITTLPIRIGVSSCLLGAQVRFDGGHKRDPFLVQGLGRHVEWVSVCPELEVGMGVPRESVRLVRVAPAADGPSLRMVAPRSGRDWTDDMLEYSRKRVKALAREDLSGYVLKSKSPSCGMERVQVWNSGGMPNKEGRGLFATVLMEELPLLPAEEDGRLNDERLRENFIERVFAYHRWLCLRREHFSAARLVEFHARHKFTLMAHCERHLRQLGRLVAAGGGKGNRRRLTVDDAEAYGKLFFEAMAILPTVKSHVNTLQHIAGFFKAKLDALDKQELVEAIDRYRRGLQPRLVPLTLIVHHLRRHQVPYIEEQFYLSPHPKELVLKNHA